MSLFFLKNGFIFALPYLAQFLMTIIIGRFVDYLRMRRTFSTTVLRKLQAIIGRKKLLLFK